jgi:hypothetical protein
VSAPLHPILTLLDDFAYLLEALAEDLPRETRNEIAQVQRRLGDARHLGLEPQLRDAVLNALGTAEIVLAKGDDARVRHAAVALASVNRKLWALPELRRLRIAECEQADSDAGPSATSP